MQNVKVDWYDTEYEDVFGDQVTDVEISRIDWDYLEPNGGGNPQVSGLDAQSFNLTYFEEF
jgi:hypothetical protein